MSDPNSVLIPDPADETPAATSRDSRLSPSTSFSSLPFELREKIWLLSLQPRVLYLHIHRRIAPPWMDQNGGIMSGPRRTISVSFTATVALSSSTASEHFSQYTDYIVPVYEEGQSFLQSSHIVATRPLGVKNSRGPAALETCRESREVALKRYELAFAGTLLDLDPSDREEWDRTRFGPTDREDWDRRRLGEKRIWVDFERDIIFIDTVRRCGTYPECTPNNPLGIIRQFATEESKKIQRLALGGSWVFGRGGGGVGMAIHEERILEGEYQKSIREKGIEGFGGFERLKELLIDDHLGAGDSPPESERSWQNWLRDEKSVAENILEVMRGKRRHFPEVELPSVKVVRGSAWTAYVEGHHYVP